MDKDNLDIQRILNGLSTDKLDSAGGEIQQQILTAFCLITFGVLLTFTGLIGLVIRLAAFVRFYFLISLRPRMRPSPSLRRKPVPKLP